MGSFRMDRIGGQIQEEIARMIMGGDIKDPRVSTFLTVNRVEVTGDLGFAKVYVSSFLGAKKTDEGLAGLQSAAGYIRTSLSKKFHIRTVPKLTFLLDSSIKEGMDMLKLLDSLKTDGPKVAATSPEGPASPLASQP
jgi:ribosome-binding factor A